MKRTILSSLIFASAFVSGIASANTVNGGRVNFEGELVNAACAVDMSSVNQTIKMGQVRTSSFTAVGATTGAVPFDIKLTGCDSSVGGTPAAGGAPAIPATVAVGFLGVQDASSATALAISGGAGAATGIGIRILDKAGTAVTFDGTPGTAINVKNGTMSIPFQASYIATAASVTAGTANSTATFTVTYL